MAVEQTHVGQKLKVVDGEARQKCSNLFGRNNDKTPVAYIVVDRVNTDGDIGVYTGYTADGREVKNCWGCIKLRHVAIYQEGKAEQMEKKYTAGDLVNVGDVAVPFADEPRAEEKVGTQYVVVNVERAGNSLLKHGQIVELQNNDRSRCPSFYISSDRADRYLNWYGLAPLPADTGKVKLIKPTVTEAVTRYNDGVELTETSVKLDGKTYTREEMTKLIARYKEVLARPYATVQSAAPKAAKKTTKKTATKKPAPAKEA